MSYWFPKLHETKVPTPSTVMVDIGKKDPNFVKAMRKLFWMEEPTKEDQKSYANFRFVLEYMARSIGGYPFFLRTGHASHKHSWKETCYVTSEENLMANAQAIAEYSIMANMKEGLPINVWVARQLLETNPAFEAFNGMPITKEMRFFIRDGKIECYHPYWPEKAIDGHTRDENWKLKLDAMNSVDENDLKLLKDLTLQVASAFEGYWSLDWLKAADGRWYAIDMATGEDSYHFPGCKNGEKK